ncbi:MAG: hypothetical protein CBB67_021130 [Alteromonadaceae bacterium TMED7]|nr:hypothetical protein [Alteromonadaceae bacterium]MCP4863084.1 hypothetical protein [Alteromonas sp.]RPH13244.1 MAG: hypothetical protein CBB67_021130 [Alteromonadaceae bacterium TMED7]|tara:strand:+ start:25846 stop:26430 length:585 start_codon:yes stop_codon:yes gene_type:complete
MKQIAALFLLAMSLYYIYLGWRVLSTKRPFIVSSGLLMSFALLIYLVLIILEAVRFSQTGSLEGQEIIMLAVTIYFGVKCWQLRRTYLAIGLADDFAPALKYALAHNQLNYCEQPGIIKVPAMPGAIEYQSKDSKNESSFNFKGSFSTTTIINVIIQLEQYFASHPFTINKKAAYEMCGLGMISLATSLALLFY